MTTIPKNSSFAGAYLRFLQLAKLAQSLPNVTSIDANETADGRTDTGKMV
jgi:hypothetical protein